MPTNKQRLQIVVSDDTQDRVQALANERGLSVSAMGSVLIHAALALKEFQPKPDLSQVKKDAVLAAIEGGDIADYKIRKLLELVEHFKE